MTRTFLVSGDCCVVLMLLNALNALNCDVIDSAS